MDDEAANLGEKDHSQADVITKGTSPDESIDSVAVLPLAIGNSDPVTECLSDGITEGIISNLSQLPRLRVIALSTVFRYKGRVEADPQKIGHELNVRAVVTGRIINLGDNIIFRMELVDVTDGSRLWGTEYKRRLSDPIEQLGEISMTISKELQIKLTGEKCGPTLHNSGSQS